MFSVIYDRPADLLASSMRREKSLHRSDSFQTRQQFARESGSGSSPYSSYAAALTGHQPPQIPIQQGQYYPQQQLQQSYLGYLLINNPSTRILILLLQRHQLQATLLVLNREHRLRLLLVMIVLDFNRILFVREFVPTGASGGGSSSGSSRSPITMKDSTTSPSSSVLLGGGATSSRHSTPPNTTATTTQQVKKTASFENNSSSSRPLTPPSSIFTRSQSASSMRPQPQPQQPQTYPTAYPAYMSTQQPMLPFPPPTLLTISKQSGDHQ